MLSFVVFTFTACRRPDPCDTSLERPGWDDSANAPRLPYLRSPAGKGAPGATSPPALSCPALADGKPALAANLEPARRPPRAYAVYLYSSPDGRQWTGAPGPIAHSFSSLAAFVAGESLYLFGSTQIPVFAPRPVVTALRTDDLRTWSGCAWSICQEPNQGLVDTEPVRLPDGSTRLWYYTVPKPPDGRPADPARAPGTHALAFADLHGDRLYARGIGYGAPGLADPSVVFFQGRWLMAATRDASRVVLAASNDGERFSPLERVFDGVSVPSFFVDGETLWLVTQRHVPGPRPGPWPYVYTSRDGVGWDEPGFLFRDLPPARGCTSPTLQRFRGQYALFCAAPE